MSEKSDIQLLRDYAENGRDAAFRELVTRHADLVYSAALRQVNSDDVARDIAQSVFIDLARKARPVANHMTDGSSLAGWLHRATYYAALNHWRDTQRRRANEIQAMEQLLIDSESTPQWEHIRPLLDEALDRLDDKDREVLLLRYFKNQDFRAVGLAMGISDDTAQKRASRALDRLREYFSRRNITIGASGLSVLISANAVHSAPVGLAAAIATGALGLGAMTASSSATATAKIVAMTTIQKAAIGAALLTLVAVAVFQFEQNSSLRDEVKTLRVLTPEVEQLQRDQDESVRQIASLRAKNADLKDQSNELRRLRAELRNFREKDNALANADGRTSEPAQPADEARTARQMDELIIGKELIVTTWLKAFQDYAKEHNGECPSDFQQAVQYLPHTAAFIANTATNFDLLYHGSFDAVKSREVILFREKNLWQYYGGKWGRLYGIANGYPQYCSSSDQTSTGSFDPYESEHIVAGAGR